MKYQGVILYIVLSVIMVSCSDISDDERLIFVKPADVHRNILIEDFTGQRCVNCPLATEEIENLQKQYGESAIVAVSIHSGPLGFYTNSRFTGLSTTTGDEYFGHWNLDYQPIGMIDRSEPMAYTSWAASIREHLEQKVSASIDIDCTVDENTGKADVHVGISGIEGSFAGKLQLWVVEDSITAFQMMPDGTRNDEYVHRHVFRSAVNGVWGEDVSVKEGETKESDKQVLLTDEWNVGNLYIVAFIYDEEGVQQVKQLKMKTRQ